MSLEWFASAAVGAAGTTLLGRFEKGTPKARRLLRWAVYLGVVALLSRTTGRPWALAWIFGLPTVGAIFRFWRCLRHGIYPPHGGAQGRVPPAQGMDKVGAMVVLPTLRPPGRSDPLPASFGRRACQAGAMPWAITRRGWKGLGEARGASRS